MGQAARKRAKKRKVERYAKHPKPTRNATSAGTVNKSRTTDSDFSRRPSVVTLEALQRSPVLSSYLASESNVLIVGDGDFSFGRALVQLRSKYRQSSHHQKCPLGSLTVTGYDNRAEALRKYGGSIIEKSLQMIQNDPDATVLHSIDATKLEEQLGSNHQKQNPQQQQLNTTHLFYDVVVFNFPHSGQQRVHINRNLMYDFFQSVRALFLAQDTHQQSTQEKQQKRTRKNPRQVQVTIKNQRPYIHWGIEESAKEAGFVSNSSVKKSKVHFDMNLWNSLGYRHQTTVGPDEATSQPQLLANEMEAKLAQTWIFEFEQDTQPRRDDDETATTNDATKGTKQPTAMSSTMGNKTNHHEVLASTKQDEAVLLATTNKHKPNKIDPQGGEAANKALIDDLVQKRDQARKDKNWVEADRIRDLLRTEHGVILCDQQQVKTTWKKKGTMQKESGSTTCPNKE
jgi:Domain of unknown function (DUF2431)